MMKNWREITGQTGVWAAVVALLASAMLSQQASAGLQEASNHYDREEYELAYAEYARVAKQGNTLALYNLGVLHEEGRGVPKDTAKAAQWYEKAAKKKEPGAQYRLGLLYEKGDGVPQNLKKAFDLIRQSAPSGSAAEWYYLGAMYYTGKGTPVNKAKAREWYEKAGKANSVDAQFNLATMYYTGDGVTKDLNQSLAWYQLAAQLNDPAAQMQVGWMYYKGEGGGSPDAQKGIAAVLHTVARRYLPAYLQLGAMYESDEQWVLARQWYTKAKKRGSKKAQALLDNLAKKEAQSINSEVVESLPVSTPASTPASTQKGLLVP